MDLSSEVSQQSVYKEALENDCAPRGISLSEDDLSDEDQGEEEDDESISGMASQSKVQV